VGAGVCSQNTSNSSGSASSSGMNTTATLLDCIHAVMCPGLAVPAAMACGGSSRSACVVMNRALASAEERTLYITARALAALLKYVKQQ
jgi:hypothetical protein